MSTHTTIHSRPRALLLSNGRYTVMLTDAGSGFSHWGELAVTRWREDPTRDPWGSYFLMRDVETGLVWSAGLQPSAVHPDSYATETANGRARITRRDGTMETTLDTVVAGDRDVEMRRVTLTNRGEGTRTVEVTSYAELVLAPAASDASHPAFSKLFVQTEWVPGANALLATRRHREKEEADVWAAHTVVVASDGRPAGPGGGAEDHVDYETARAAFLGRGRTLTDARALEEGRGLSRTVGSVIDPIFSLRRRVRIAPGDAVELAFWTCMADSRDAALTLAREVDSPEACERALKSASERLAGLHTRLGMDEAAVERCHRLVAPLLYSDPAWRAPAGQLARGRGGPPVLWAKGISGDRPVVLLRIEQDSDLDHVDELLRAQRYWRSQGLGVDVVVLPKAAEDEAEGLHAALTPLIDAQASHLGAEGDGPAHAPEAGVFVLRDDQISDAVGYGLATVARVVLSAGEGGMGRPGAGPTLRGAVESSQPAPAPSSRAALASSPTTDGNEDGDEVEFGNGYGGFTQDGREYLVMLEGEGRRTRATPAPWSNVVANPGFGFMVTAEGGGHTFSTNSQQNPLTPWPNDPVSDTPTEVIYLRDSDSGELWSATALPLRAPDVTYTTRHGKGYTLFHHVAHGIEVELLQFVPTQDSVKLSRVRIHNRSANTRRLSITAYIEWALGPNGTVPAPTVVTSRDAVTGALFARNTWRDVFGGRFAFADLCGRETSWTCDRTEFLGRLGAMDRPTALSRNGPLSGRAGAGIDPCAALQAEIELAPDTEQELVFLLGDAASEHEAQALVQRYRNVDTEAVLSEVRDIWGHVQNAVQVTTPDRAMDILLNEWLLYQSLSCRVWARAAYYQSSGAYGFRDQLQDGLSLCVARPDVVREHLLRSAGRQFTEGDVQHWWLPPKGTGIRTRMTDDRVWLPYVAMHYIEVTGDARVLDEMVPFLDGPALEDGQNEAFFLPTVSGRKGSLYEHCARALDVSLSLGPHDLPLMGTGDWNDGMNRVGVGGKGESVWLAWFLLDTIARFTPVAEAHGDSARVVAWQTFVDTVLEALEREGWDGAWYRRGYYDDGTPLGSDQSEECKIDAIAQSWSVISGAADPERAVQAMAAVDTHLVDREHRVAMLFTPPFDRVLHDPGYIKGYPPGIRENGGQYTHGSLWSVFAWSRLGDGDKAGELFDIFNPIRHSNTPQKADRYKVEPYVSCADVYSVERLAGRGGWTWYTGSAGWLYRAGLEAMLGFHVRGDHLRIDPCIPRAWPGFSITYRRGASVYRIEVENPKRVSRGVTMAELDGIRVELPPATIDDSSPATSGVDIPLHDDGNEHHVRVVLG